MMALAVDVSRFVGMPMAPPDPILRVSEAFTTRNHLIYDETNLSQIAKKRHKTTSMTISDNVMD